MDERLRALNRFGLGARVGEREAIQDPKGWLHQQLDRFTPEPADAEDAAAGYAVFIGFSEASRAGDGDRLAKLRKKLSARRADGVYAMLKARITTETPFVERLVAFWSNHLCVSIESKRRVAALAADYEREVARRHVLGRFDEMVLASARHPAMLLYLDNAESIGPGSTVGLRLEAEGTVRGLNENYARELLELHTLGIQGGYEQRDVVETARALTGWSLAGVGPDVSPGEPSGFVYRPSAHEPGSKSVLGRSYPEAGMGEGEKIIHDLCVHPSTARFLATKLVRHFVADEPPPAAVERIAATFLRTSGDLRAVAEALIDLEDAWRSEHRKLRTPQDWLVAALRAARCRMAPARAPRILTELRHTAWAPQGPNGFEDAQRAWDDPDSIRIRTEMAWTLAEAFVGESADDGIRTIDLAPSQLESVLDLAPDDPLASMLNDVSIPVTERVALALGGPAFQWR